MTIFRQAVLRLTLWYLAGILLLSVIFSIALYNVSTRELNTLQDRQQALMMRVPTNLLPPGYAEFNQARLQQIEDSKDHIAGTLIYFNLIILALGGAISYLLAKRTLRPIEESVETQARFTADASHELRTPLTAMRTELEVALRDSKLSLAESKELHTSTLEEIAKLERLTEGLLQMAKHDKFRREVLEPCQLTDIVKDAANRVQGRADDKKVTLNMEGGEGTVTGDRWALTELLVILLDNAIKYSPEKSTVTVEAAVGRQYAIFQVKDEGVGIHAQDLPHIFDRFFRVDASRSKSNADGYGLGLSIAKQIVDAHHGSIEVKSRVGHGSVFTARIPITPPKKLL